MAAVWVKAARPTRWAVDWAVATAKVLAVEARPVAMWASVTAAKELASSEAAGMAAVARAEDAAL